MSTVWKGTLSFGLVNIPVKVSVAGRPSNIEFHTLHETCGSRIKQKIFCPSCNRDIERSETTKGYEYSKDRYVTVQEEELKAVQPESSQTLEIESIVSASEVDPMLFESSFYLEPETAGTKGYKLLYESLRQAGQYAIAKITKNNREHTIVIRPYGSCLAFHTLFYESEVRAAPSIGLDGVQVKPAELKLAGELLKAYVKPFHHGEYADNYQRAVGDLLTAKQEGHKVKTIAKKPPKKETGDLMSALNASIKLRKTA
jgi:DNA end-binding protein Ku